MSCKKHTAEATKQIKMSGGQTIAGQTCLYVASIEQQTGPYKNGIEISFDKKPPEDVLDQLRAAGFRYHARRCLWYAVETSEKLEVAKTIMAGGLAKPPIEELPVTKNAPAKKSKPKEQSMELKSADALFVMPDGGRRGKSKRMVDNAFSAINQVHGFDKNFRPIPVQFRGASKKMEAGLVVTRHLQGVPLVKRMVVCDGLFLDETNIVHEVGHYLDYEMMRTNPQWGTQRAVLLNAIRITKAYDFYSNFKRNKVIDFTISQDGGTYKDTATLGEFGPTPSKRKYLLSDTELIARSYAQYIALKSGKGKKLIEDQNRFHDDYVYNKRKGGYDIARSHPTQWEWDDFEPVAKEFDKIFTDLGWLQKK